MMTATELKPRVDALFEWAAPSGIERRPAQEDCIAKLIDGVESGHDVDIWKRRGTGGTTIARLVTLWAAATRNHFDVVWVFRRCCGLQEGSLDWYVERGLLSDHERSASCTEIHFQKTGSCVRLMREGADVGRGSRLGALVMDESFQLEYRSSIIAAAIGMTRCVIQINTVESIIAVA